jgi:putative membrane protein
MARRVEVRGFWLWMFLVLGALTLLLVGLRCGVGIGALNLRNVPRLNACLNACVAGLLVAGRFAAARGNARLHRRLMTAAFATSIVFLVGYLSYHAAHGDTKFGGAGALRVAYLSLLATHVLASAVVPPLAVTAIWLALKGRLDTHRRVTRWLFPIWLYVAVTGVAVFLFLRPYYPAA